MLKKLKQVAKTQAFDVNAIKQSCKSLQGYGFAPLVSREFDINILRMEVVISLNKLIFVDKLEK